MSQFMRPNSDIAEYSLWGPSTGVTCYGCIDEESYSDSDYISVALTNKIQMCGLSTPGDTPGSGGGTLRYRAKAGSSGKVVIVRVYCGGTQIKSVSQSLTTSYATYTLSLSEAEMANITDWTTVRVYMATDGSFGTRYVSWVEFEVPDEAASVIGLGLEMGIIA